MRLTDSAAGTKPTEHEMSDHPQQATLGACVKRHCPPAGFIIETCGRRRPASSVQSYAYLSGKLGCKYTIGLSGGQLSFDGDERDRPS
ncbi:hypothetical protein RRSWK_02743 [Rhodopirellula sp. SWK7]|nr:hypothetical protein RRSWK_02743 [Rhodopirellula sp. SWK7]